MTCRPWPKTNGTAATRAAAAAKDFIVRRVLLEIRRVVARRYKS